MRKCLVLGQKVSFIFKALCTSITPMDFSEQFKGKKITVMGLGLLGRGVGDAAYLAECGAEVTVTDLKSEEQLTDSVEKLKLYPNVRFALNGHKEEDFENVDMVLVAAGVPFDSPYLAHAHKAGVPLKQSAALFAELSGIPIIGVTGTRGKSTVTAMVHHVLSVTTGEHIIKGGNVRGVSNLQLLKEVKEDSLAVLELDSWQLQGFGWAGISPQIVVFTNFMPDHMNYYKNDMDAYFTDKANIFLHQKESGVFITVPEVFERAKKMAGTLGQEVVLVDDSTLPEDVLLSMPGEHNRLNAALAVAALRAVSLTDEEIFTGLASFSGVEGRLQLLTTVDNVRIYNDNNATTPQATVAALEALDVGNKNIVLIAGGADKGLELLQLTAAIREHCKQTILIPGTGTERLLAALEGGNSTVNRTIAVEDLQQAVEEARLAAKNGDIILFSPAFSSFSQYNNEYERNDEFVELVKKYE